MPSRRQDSTKCATGTASESDRKIGRRATTHGLSYSIPTRTTSERSPTRCPYSSYQIGRPEQADTRQTYHDMADVRQLYPGLDREQHTTEVHTQRNRYRQQRKCSVDRELARHFSQERPLDCVTSLTYSRVATVLVPLTLRFAVWIPLLLFRLRHHSARPLPLLRAKARVHTMRMISPSRPTGRTRMNARAKATASRA